MGFRTFHICLKLYKNTFLDIYQEAPQLLEPVATQKCGSLCLNETILNMKNVKTSSQLIRLRIQCEPNKVGNTYT